MKRWQYICLGAATPLIFLVIIYLIGALLFYGFRYSSQLAGSIGITILYGSGILFLPIGLIILTFLIIVGGLVGFLISRNKTRQ